MDKAKLTFDEALNSLDFSSHINAVNKGRRSSEAALFLGIFSGFTALVPIALYAYSVTNSKDVNLFTSTDIALPATLVAITSILLVLFTELQRRFSKTSAYDVDQETSDISLAQSLSWKLSDQGTLVALKRGGDYLFTTNSGKRIIVEIKSGNKWFRMRALSSIVSVLQDSLKENNASIVAIVVPTEIFLNSKSDDLPKSFEMHTVDSLRAKAISLNNAR